MDANNQATKQKEDDPAQHQGSPDKEETSEHNHYCKHRQAEMAKKNINRTTEEGTRPEPLPRQQDKDKETNDKETTNQDEFTTDDPMIDELKTKIQHDNRRMRRLERFTAIHQKWLDLGALERTEIVSKIYKTNQDQQQELSQHDKYQRDMENYRDYMITQLTISKAKHNVNKKHLKRLQEEAGQEQQDNPKQEGININAHNLTKVRLTGTHTQTGLPVDRINIINMEATTRETTDNEDQKATENFNKYKEDSKESINDPIPFYASPWHHQHYKMNTVLAKTGARHFRTPSDSLATILCAQEENTRPGNIEEKHRRHIHALHKAIKWNKIGCQDYFKYKFPVWDNDTHLPDTHTPNNNTNTTSQQHEDQEKTIPLTQEQTRDFKQLFGKGGRKPEESYWYTRKGQWRAQEDPEEAARLLEMRDVIKEMEEKHLYLVTRHQENHKALDSHKQYNYLIHDDDDVFYKPPEMDS
jgi:hypothetical protein